MKNHGPLIKNYQEIGITEMRESILDLVSSSMSLFNPSAIMRREIVSIEDDFSMTGKGLIIGFGKCSLSMFRGIPDSLLSRISYSGVVVPKGMEVAEVPHSLEVLRGNHPIIGKDTEEASRRLLSMLNGLSEEDFVLVLISGGGSALFEVPEDGISYDLIASVSKCVMNNGGDIDELNAIRQIMSKVKGGKLADFLFPARVFSFVVSDVPGDREDIIASGPLVRPKTTPEEKAKIIGKFKKACPNLEILENACLDTRVSEDTLKNVDQKIILRNHDIVSYIIDQLREKGIPVLDMGSMIQGNVVDVSKILVERMRREFHNLGPFFMVGGGETTVEVAGDGVGGRNCELSVRVARLMGKDEIFLFSSIGTDGIDGVSPAMGGIVDTVFRDDTMDSEIDESLARNDTYTLLSRKHSAIVTGFTENNVSDIMIGYYGGKK